jgi:hypothetical protein
VRLTQPRPPWGLSTNLRRDRYSWVAVRLLLQLGLTKLTDTIAPLHSYPHLIIGVVMLVLTTAGAWFDQWLVLRVVNRTGDAQAARSTSSPR